MKLRLFFSMLFLEIGLLTSQVGFHRTAQCPELHSNDFPRCSQEQQLGLPKPSLQSRTLYLLSSAYILTSFSPPFEMYRQYVPRYIWSLARPNLFQKQHLSSCGCFLVADKQRISFSGSVNPTPFCQHYVHFN